MADDWAQAALDPAWGTAGEPSDTTNAPAAEPDSWGAEAQQDAAPDELQGNVRSSFAGPLILIQV
ncbi:MAG: hypothetical protein M1819_004877 [Sarea resinae]|nr:MAG: hypothetical protein M1819_004877 [Sarea resinae]